MVIPACSRKMHTIWHCHGFQIIEIMCVVRFHEIFCSYSHPVAGTHKGLAKDGISAPLRMCPTVYIILNQDISGNHICMRWWSTARVNPGELTTPKNQLNRVFYWNFPAYLSLSHCFKDIFHELSCLFGYAPFGSIQRIVDRHGMPSPQEKSHHIRLEETRPSQVAAGGRGSTSQRGHTTSKNGHSTT